MSCFFVCLFKYDYFGKKNKQLAMCLVKSINHFEDPHTTIIDQVYQVVCVKNIKAHKYTCGSFIIFAYILYLLSYILVIHVI